MNIKILEDLFFAGLKAVSGYNAVEESLPGLKEEFEQGGYKRLVVLGFGKASFQMAQAVEAVIGDLVTDGLIITKYKHGGKLDKIGIIEAAHPVPDKKGLIATDRLLQLISKYAKRDTLFLCLISGGGSSLLVAPYDGISLEEKSIVTELLLKSGANIEELNTVRKHISKVKGGRLAEKAYPACIISFVISDVIGDNLGIIASGPTSPDSTTYEEALGVLKKYNLLDRVPASILDVLRKGCDGFIPETLKENSRVFENVENRIIANNMKALLAVKEKAIEYGFLSEILSSTLDGEAREVANYLASIAIKEREKCAGKYRCIVSGGETTVTVKGSGLGGRNMELALAFAIRVSEKKGITMLSAGSDGTDGPTDAAGAIVDCNTVHKARSMGLEPEEYLDNNDSYTFFKKVGGLFITGPTGTNVMDIQIMLMEGEQC